MAKTFYMGLDRPPLESVAFRQIPSPLTSAKLAVHLQSHKILGILEVAFQEGAVPVVVEKIRINETFSPTLFLPYAVPAADGRGTDPLYSVPPIILEEPGDSLQAVIRIEGIPGSLNVHCYPGKVEMVVLSTNCGELRFERDSL